MLAMTPNASSVPSGTPSASTSCTELRRAAVRALSGRLGVEVSARDLDAAMDRIARDHGLTVDALRAALPEQGWTVEGYRAELRHEILAFRVASLLMERPTDEEVRAEAECSGATVDAARSAMLARRRDEVLDRAVERMRALRPRAGPSGCEEVGAE